MREIDNFGTTIGSKILNKVLKKKEIIFMHQDHLHCNIVKIGQNTQQSPEDLRRFACT